MIPESDLVDPVQKAVAGSTAATPGFPRLAHRQIALLDNTKPGAAKLLTYIGEELERCWSCEVEIVAKASAALMDDLIFRELSARFHGIVTGIGD